MPDFEKMQPNELQTCARLAARAFADYEYFANYVPNDRRRLRFLNVTMEAEFAVNDGRAVFFTAKEERRIAAVAMLCAPDWVKPTDAAYLKAGFFKAFLLGGVGNVAAWLDMETKAAAPCHKQEGAWYLNLLTVDPSKKGRSIGSGMLRECVVPYVLRRGGDSLCLFTNSAENRKFYQKNGFREFDARTFSYKGKTLGSWSYVLELKN